MSAAICVENVAKRYRVATVTQGSYRTLRESIAASVSDRLRQARAIVQDRRSHQQSTHVEDAKVHWALRDVTFEIEHGETVGIIGRNGAGKSTLLKILSRITAPTCGMATIQGRVGSLLEVGTGFHPELTGRENIFLNGAILGMTRREIRGRFDRIVEFAEVSKFLDTQVKYYSSGMYTRLAFAVASHLDPEILIVDEVLAVGDSAYQRRCVNRMSELARSGKTILFVSHNLELIPRLCQKAILLEQGRVSRVGPASGIVEHYLCEQRGVRGSGDLCDVHRRGSGVARFQRMDLLDRDGHPTLVHRSGDDIRIRLTIESKESITDAEIAVNLLSIHGTRLVSAWTREAGVPVTIEPGIQTFECRLERIRTRPGQRVQIGLWLAHTVLLDGIDEAFLLETIDGLGTDGFCTGDHHGPLLHEYSWRVPTEPSEAL